MPSLQHTLVSWALPFLRRNGSPDDVPALRRALIEENRKAREAPPQAVRRTHEESIGNTHGFPVFELWPAGTEVPKRAVLYLHGGAYVHPSDPRQWSFVTRVADAIGARAVVPAYPLAPEFTVDDSFDAMVAIYDDLVASSPDGVVLLGDSSGGGYALALAEALRDPGGPQPDRLVLIAPWVDLTGSTPGTAEAAERDPWLSYAHLPLYASFWAGTDDLDRIAADARVSPGLGDLSGLPPALMLCGTRDLLQPGCDALFERADAADWPLEYVLAPGLLHVYPLLPVPEARPAFDQIVEFCRQGRHPLMTEA
jgi:monoterpene epsilon-lactone hydrolase